MAIKVVKRKKINRAGNVPKRQKNTMKFESITQERIDKGFSKPLKGSKVKNATNKLLSGINKSRARKYKETKMK